MHHYVSQRNRDWGTYEKDTILPLMSKHDDVGEEIAR